MKRTIFYLSCVLLVCMSTIIISCSKDDSVRVTASFATETVDVATGKSYKQSVNTNCPNANIVYSSSDQSVATVNPSTGEVAALAKGSTTITATVSVPQNCEGYVGTCTASYLINVLETITASFKNDAVDVAIGQSHKQSVTTNCPNANIVYSSSDQSVATVNPSTGEVTALAKGSTTITATVKAPEGDKNYVGTISASYQVNVDYNSLGTITIGFSSSFSPDFLELITPIVTYRDKDGEHEVRLNKDMCEYLRKEYNNNNEILVYERYMWQPSIVCKIYEDKDFDETVSVHFESNNKNVEANRKYDLSVSSGVGSVNQSFFYNGAMHTGSSTYMSINIKINIGDGVNHDDDIYEGESVQKYIEEIVKTKQDFKVEVSKDGKVKVNGK